jgi:hypothetical protein
MSVATCSASKKSTPLPTVHKLWVRQIRRALGSQHNSRSSCHSTDGLSSAGAPAIAMAVLAALLGIYKSVKDWIEFGNSAVRVGRVAGQKFRSSTTSQQRAMGRLFVFSVLTVAFSYMVAVIVVAVVQQIKLDPNAVFSVHDIVDRVAVTPWSPAAVWTVVGEVVGIGLLGIACMGDLQGLRKLVTGLGRVVCVVTWLVGSMLAVDAAMMGLGLLLSRIPTNSGPTDAPPVPLLVTVTVTALLSLVLARLLPRIQVASTEAFGSARAPRGRILTAP